MPDINQNLNNRTVLHGVDESVATYSDLPSKGNYASRCITEDVLGHHFYDPQARAWKPFAIIPFEFAALGTDPDGNNNKDIGFHDTGVVVPAGTVVMDGVIDVVEAFTGAGASVLLKFEAAAGDTGDILDTTAVGSLTAALAATVSDGQLANMKKATVNRMIKARVTGGTLTGGHLFGFLRCVNSWLAADVQSSSSSSSSSSSISSSSSSSKSSSSSSCSSSRSSVSVSSSSSSSSSGHSSSSSSSGTSSASSNSSSSSSSSSGTSSNSSSSSSSQSSSSSSSS